MEIPIHILFYDKLLKNLYDGNFTSNLVKNNDDYRKNMAILPDQNFTVFSHL